MKNFILIIAIFLLSCESVLDRPQPESTIPIESAFTSIEDIESALRNSYTSLRGIEAQMMFSSDLVTDNINFLGGATNDGAVVNPPFDPTANRIVNMWRLSYRAINEANLALSLLEEFADLGTEGQRNLIKGDALFVRSLAYFEMLKVYCKPFDNSSENDLGLPILTAPTTSVSEVLFPCRSSVTEVYNLIIKDLNEAIELLPVGFRRGRAHEAAAQAYLARVYFQRREYEIASQLASQIIDSSGFRLNSDPLIFYVDEGSSEEIFSVVRTDNDPSGALSFRSASNFMALSEDLLENGFGRIVTENQKVKLLGDSLETIDLRFILLTSTDERQITPAKYRDPVGADDNPVLRLAEFILMRAECLAWLNGINAESIELLNQIRRRSLRVVDKEGNEIPDANSYFEFEVTDFNSVDELVEAIILERRVEYFLEGNRFHDLMRLRRPVKGLSYNDEALRWPIPQREVDANPNLAKGVNCN